MGVRLQAALVVALATGLRLVWVLAVPTRPVGDFAMYLEAAAHLVEHGALDPEFVYMPGYVMLLSVVRAAGGGWLAAKLVGALLGGLGAGAVYGLAHHLWARENRWAALAAGGLYAIWPAGIAVASVTGTDMPAAVLIAGAAFCLVHWGPRRPVVAALAFGAAMGLAAWIRAVALPLAAFAAIYFLARGARPREALRGAALAVLAAALVLAPWAVRNRLRYGETFFTDSHGGLTALVGANPNSEGAYSRSLNRMFRAVTGYELLAEPHREADQAAYALARDWAASSPPYAAGLVVAKAERLLANERALLYWPLFRAGVLDEPARGWFASRRRELEALADGFWALLVGGAALGGAIAAARRRWEVLAFVPMQLALVGIYALFFAEVRYHLPIAVLLFPLAGVGLAWLGESAVASARERRPPAGLAREAVAGALAVALLFGGWAATLAIGARLREGHRWAVAVCRVGDEARFCKWRPVGPGPSRVLGVWNGVGVSLPSGGGAAAAEVALSVPAGRHRVRGVVDLAPPTDGAGKLVLRAAGVSAESALGTAAGPLALDVEHGGGPLVIRVEVEGRGPARAWLSELVVERR